jgi:hypothetical protein
VTKRTLTSSRDEVQSRMQSGEYRGVIADARRAPDLLPMWIPESAEHRVDFSKYTGARSEAEKVRLSELAVLTSKTLERAAKGEVENFRGAASQYGLASACVRTDAEGFTQYRGGFQDDLGRCVDLTRVTPKTPEWTERLNRVYRGMKAVEKLCSTPGVSVAKLNSVMCDHLDPTKDQLCSNAVHYTGFRGVEPCYLNQSLQPHESVTIGVTIKAVDGETAKVYPSIRFVDDAYKGASDDEHESDDDGHDDARDDARDDEGDAQQVAVAPAAEASPRRASAVADDDVLSFL